jgi:hypothetical protein
MEILMQLATFPDSDDGLFNDDWGSSPSCGKWSSFQLKILKRFNSNLGALDRFSDIIDEERGYLGRVLVTASIWHRLSWTRSQSYQSTQMSFECDFGFSKLL